MKILFEELSEPQRAGGIEAACAGLTTRLSGLGHELVRHDSSGFLSSGWQPDLVHVHGIWSPQLMVRWRRWQEKGNPVVVTVHGMLEPWAFAHKQFKKRLAWAVYQKRMLQSASLLHGTSQREVTNLRGLGLRPPLALIPWGIGLDKAVDMEQGISAVERAKRVALFVGRLYPVKGLPMLLEAWKRVRPSGWELRLVGPDEAGHRAELEAMIARLGLGGMVSFTGPLYGKDLNNEYRRASLFVLPSHTENFGMAVGEALAHGLPAITTQGAPWKLLQDERCGWWVPVSVDDIASALNEATLRKPEELADMGGRGRKVVEERFSWDNVARQFIACYEWVVGRGDKPGCVE